MKLYVVACNANPVCICKANSKEDAIRRVDNRYAKVWFHRNDWKAYDADEYFEDDEVVMINGEHIDYI